MKRFSLRLEKDLHEKLRLESFETGRSINEIIVELIGSKYEEDAEMKKLYELKEGKRAFLFKGNLESTIEFLKENEDVYNWQLDKDTKAEQPDLDEIYDWSDLEYELDRMSLGWWDLKLEEDGNIQEVLQELKGKGFEEGKKVVANNFEVNESKLYSFEEEGRIDTYAYVEDGDNWICFTSSCTEVESDEGYWNVCDNGEVTTELEV